MILGKCCHIRRETGCFLIFKLSVLTLNCRVEEKLELRVWGDPSLRALVYLPGLHGDWTIIGALRAALAGHVRFVEMNYPRTLTWSLDDYASAIEEELAKAGITDGWLLGESFGSQPMWRLIARDKFHTQGAVLAGGFVRYPWQPFLRTLEKWTGGLLSFLFVEVIFGWARVARYRYRDPHVLATLDEFLARRREPMDHKAAQHRLQLVGESDARTTAMTTQIPIFGLAGVIDPIVPWPHVRRWLKRYCPTLRDYRIIRHADHNVLNTGTKESAKWILEWMQVAKAVVNV